MSEVIVRPDVLGLPPTFRGMLVFHPMDFTGLSMRMSKDNVATFLKEGTLYGISVGVDDEVPFGRVWADDADGDRCELFYYIRVGLDGTAIPTISDREPGSRSIQ